MEIFCLTKNQEKNWRFFVFKNLGKTLVICLTKNQEKNWRFFVFKILENSADLLLPKVREKSKIFRFYRSRKKLESFRFSKSRWATIKTSCPPSVRFIAGVSSSAYFFQLIFSIKKTFELFIRSLSLTLPLFLHLQSQQAPTAVQENTTTELEPDVVLQTQQQQQAASARTKREISAVTAQILNYAEVNVLVPKLKIVPVAGAAPATTTSTFSTTITNPVKNNTGTRVNYSQVQIPIAAAHGRPPLQITRGTHTDDTGSRTPLLRNDRKNSSDYPQFSGLDYIDSDSPRGEPMSVQQYNNRSQIGHLYPRVINQTSSAHIHAHQGVDMEERRGMKAMDENNRNGKLNGFIKRDIQ